MMTNFIIYNILNFIPNLLVIIEHNETLIAKASLGDWANFGLFIIGSVTIFLAVRAIIVESASITIDFVQENSKDLSATYKIKNQGLRPVRNSILYLSKNQFEKISYIPKDGEIVKNISVFHLDKNNQNYPFLKYYNNPISPIKVKAFPSNKIHLTKKVRFKNFIYSILRWARAKRAIYRDYRTFIIKILHLKRLLIAYRDVSNLLRLSVDYKLRETSIQLFLLAEGENIKLLQFSNKINLYKNIVFIEHFLKKFSIDSEIKGYNVYYREFKIDKILSRYSIVKSFYGLYHYRRNINLNKLYDLFSLQSSQNTLTIYNTSLEKIQDDNNRITKFIKMSRGSQYPIRIKLPKVKENKNKLFILSSEKDSIFNARYLILSDIFILDQDGYFILLDSIPAKRKIYFGVMLNTKEFFDNFKRLKITSF